MSKLALSLCLIMLTPFIFNFIKVAYRFIYSKYFFKGEIRARYKDKTVIILRSGKVEAVDNE